MYAMEPIVWVEVATMHFQGPAVMWLQSVDHRVCSTTWRELCSWLHNHLGRDQHDSLIRQLFHIRQVGSICEYINKFSELVDQLVAYDHCVEDLYFTTQFVDGPKNEMKYVVLVQRPADLDTTCALALLQEKRSPLGTRTLSE
jgi:hypothetical protein